MKQIFTLIDSIGGACFYTGASLRDQLLNRPASHFEILVYGITKSELDDVMEKTGHSYDQTSAFAQTPNGTIQFIILHSLRDLHTYRGFTIDSILSNCITGSFYDPYSGLVALKNKQVIIHKDILLASPSKMLEACRLACELGFNLGIETWFDIYENARIVKYIPVDEFRKELNSILSMNKPSEVFKLLQETTLLEYCLPELAACANVIQNKRSGVRNVLEHILYALDACENVLALRLVILFHDMAKPQTLEIGDDGKIHFFKHEVIGSKLAKQYMRYWGYEKELIHTVSHLVLHHMFDADPRLTDKSVRRLIKKVGKEYIYDLVKIRSADRQGAPGNISMKKIKVLKKKIDKEISNV